MKLISMTDFVLEQRQIQIRPSELAMLSVNYARFLKTTLNLRMFVPCDENNNVLEKPIIPWQYNIEHEGLHNMYKSKLKKYQQAKERVLFEDISIVKASKNISNIYLKGSILVVFDVDYNEFRASKKIEDLLKLNQDLKLTKSAQKQLGL